jgi:hypothetical protein
LIPQPEEAAQSSVFEATDEDIRFLMDRSLLPESKVKALCDKAREIMASEDNVVEVHVTHSHGERG